METEYEKSTLTLDDIDKLLYAESPYRWKPTIREENRHEIDLPQNEASTFCYYNFVAQIVDSYDLFEKKNVSESLKIVENLVEKLNRLKTEKCEDPFFNQISDALCHVVYTWQVQLLLLLDPTSDITPILKEVISGDKMDARNKAALQAIRSSVEALFSYDGTCSAIGHIKKALSIDPRYPFWLFLNGMYLYKIRNLNNMDEPPSLEEKRLLEEANQLENNNPLFMLYLADVYRENMVHAGKQEGTYSWYLPDAKSRSNLAKKIDEKGETSLKLYRQSYELKSCCPLISFRCAYGLMMLPAKYRDIKLAKKIIFDNIKKYPRSGYGNSVAAMYHKSYGKNADLANEYLKKGVELNVFKAHMNKIRQEYQEHVEKNTKYDVISEMKNLLEKFVEIPKQGIILSQIVSYYLFQEYNLRKACEYTMKYLTSQINGTCLQIHRSCFHQFEEPISLIDVLTDEIKYTLNSFKLQPEMRTFLNEFVQKMNFQNLTIVKGKPRNLRKQLLGRQISTGRKPSYSNQQPRGRDGQMRNPGRSHSANPSFKSEKIRNSQMKGEPIVSKLSPRSRKVSERQKSPEQNTREEKKSSEITGPVQEIRKIEKRVEEKENTKPNTKEGGDGRNNKNTEKVIEEKTGKTGKLERNTKVDTVQTDELENFFKRWNELSLRNRNDSKLKVRNSGSVHKVKDTVGDRAEEEEALHKDKTKKASHHFLDDRHSSQGEGKYRSRRECSSSSESRSSHSYERKDGREHRRSNKKRHRRRSYSNGSNGRHTVEDRVAEEKVLDKEKTKKASHHFLNDRDSSQVEGKYRSHRERSSSSESRSSHSYERKDERGHRRSNKGRKRQSYSDGSNDRRRKRSSSPRKRRTERGDRSRKSRRRYSSSSSSSSVTTLSTSSSYSSPSTSSTSSTESSLSDNYRSSRARNSKNERRHDKSHKYERENSRHRSDKTKSRSQKR